MMLKRKLRVTRAYEGRDPMVPGAVWFSALDVLPCPEQVELKPTMWFGEVITIEPDVQHNRHVMDYWAARLDRLMMRTIGRK